jgi:hypothetical protein
MEDDQDYSERVSSTRTAALFVLLTLLFVILCAWRIGAGRLDFVAILCGLLSVVFLFYTFNFRTLRIRLSARSLTLTFGLFSWRVPLENVAAFGLDDVPFIKRMGGAGIHFMFVRQRYRVSFNFLEYPRVVIALKRKRGRVEDVSFSTRCPEEILRRLQTALSADMGHG